MDVKETPEPSQPDSAATPAGAEIPGNPPKPAESDVDRRKLEGGFVELSEQERKDLLDKSHVEHMATDYAEYLDYSKVLEEEVSLASCAELSAWNSAGNLLLFLSAGISFGLGFLLLSAGISDEIAVTAAWW